MAKMQKPPKALKLWALWNGHEYQTYPNGTPVLYATLRGAQNCSYEMMRPVRLAVNPLHRR